MFLTFCCYFTCQKAHEINYNVSETQKIFAVLHSASHNNQYKLHMYLVLMSYFFMLLQSTNWWFVLRKIQRCSKFLRTIIPEKKQRCKAKYFVSCTKISSCNNNIKQDNVLQKHVISWHNLILHSTRQANFHAVHLTLFMFYVLDFLYFSLTLFCITAK